MSQHHAGCINIFSQMEDGRSVSDMIMVGRFDGAISIVFQNRKDITPHTLVNFTQYIHNEKVIGIEYCKELDRYISWTRNEFKSWIISSKFGLPRISSIIDLKPMTNGRVVGVKPIDKIIHVFCDNGYYHALDYRNGSLTQLTHKLEFSNRTLLYTTYSPMIEHVRIESIWLFWEETCPKRPQYDNSIAFFTRLKLLQGQIFEIVQDFELYKMRTDLPPCGYMNISPDYSIGTTVPKSHFDSPIYIVKDEEIETICDERAALWDLSNDPPTNFSEMYPRASNDLVLGTNFSEYRYQFVTLKKQEIYIYQLDTHMTYSLSVHDVRSHHHLPLFDDNWNSYEFEMMKWSTCGKKLVTVMNDLSLMIFNPDSDDLEELPTLEKSLHVKLPPLLGSLTQPNKMFEILQKDYMVDLVIHSHDTHH